MLRYFKNVVSKCSLSHCYVIRNVKTPQNSFVAFILKHYLINIVKNFIQPFVRDSITIGPELVIIQTLQNH